MKRMNGDNPTDYWKSIEPQEHDDWVEWAQAEIFFSKDDVPSRENKELKIRPGTTRMERMLGNLIPKQMKNDLDAYDTDPEADETFTRDFYEQAVDELKHSLGIDRVPVGDGIDLRDLDDFVQYVHTSPEDDEGETLEAERNKYVGAVHEPLEVGGRAEGLNIVRTGHENLDLDLEDIDSGILYAMSGDDLEADLPDVEAYSDVYLVSIHGDVRVDADEVCSGSHIYAESVHGDAFVEVDGVVEDGVVDVRSTHGDTYVRGEDIRSMMQEDNISAGSIHGKAIYKER